MTAVTFVIHSARNLPAHRDPDCDVMLDVMLLKPSLTYQIALCPIQKIDFELCITKKNNNFCFRREFWIVLGCRYKFQTWGLYL